MTSYPLDPQATNAIAALEVLARNLPAINADDYDFRIPECLQTLRLFIEERPTAPQSTKDE